MGNEARRHNKLPGSARQTRIGTGKRESVLANELHFLRMLHASTIASVSHVVSHVHSQPIVPGLFTHVTIGNRFGHIFDGDIYTNAWGH